MCKRAWPFWPFGLAMTINCACYKKCITRSLIVSYCPIFSNALNCFQATNKSRKCYMHSFGSNKQMFITFLLKTFLICTCHCGYPPQSILPTSAEAIRFKRGLRRQIIRNFNFRNKCCDLM